MAYTSRLFYILCLLILIFGFQNCVNPLEIDQEESFLASKQSGNGGGYEGKPEGIFYHYTPNFSCESTPAADKILGIPGILWNARRRGLEIA